MQSSHIEGSLRLERLEGEGMVLDGGCWKGSQKREQAERPQRAWNPLSELTMSRT